MEIKESGRVEGGGLGGGWRVEGWFWFNSMEKKKITQLKAITKRIDLIHANGSRDEFDSSRDRHSNFAESLLPQDQISQVVKDAGCNVIIETAEPDRKSVV